MLYIWGNPNTERGEVLKNLINASTVCRTILVIILIDIFHIKRWIY